MSRRCEKANEVREEEATCIASNIRLQLYRSLESLAFGSRRSCLTASPLIART